MGTWGIDSFWNDGALDLLAEYEDGGVGAVASAFVSLLSAAEEGYIEAPIAEAAVAAAEIVAVSHGVPGTAVTAQERAVIDLHDTDVRDMGELVELAIASLQIVASDPERSELRGMWEDSGQGEVWLAAIADLQRRLATIPR
jgi:hypothetical protein